jgi:hypothetical protein
VGRLKGDGWTVGSYLGWKITQSIRFDAGVSVVALYDHRPGGKHLLAGPPTALAGDPQVTATDRTCRTARRAQRAVPPQLITGVLPDAEGPRIGSRTQRHRDDPGPAKQLLLAQRHGEHRATGARVHQILPIRVVSVSLNCCRIADVDQAFASPEAAPVASIVAPDPVVTAPGPAASVVASLPAPSGSSWLAILVACWSGIAAFLSLRSFGGWLGVQRLAHRNVAPAARTIDAKAAELCERLGVTRAVRVMLSTAAEVPGVVGWLKPVVLLPVTVVTALTPEQIEQILAHELAHVRRHDYVVNLFQTAVENVLFYHPAVWWISGRVRAERENCCDDLAVATCGDATAYARTLAQLETLRGTAPALLPAASGGSLLARVRRLLGQERSSGTVSGWAGLVVPVAIVTLAFVTVPSPKAETATPSPAPAPVAVPAPEPRPAPETKPATAPPPPKSGTSSAPAPHARPATTPRPEGAPAPVALPSEAPTTPAPAPYARPAAEASPDAASTPTPVAASTPRPKSDGYLAGLSNAGYTDISVDDIITLREHGVDPSYIKAMLGAGLGRLSVEQLVRLHDHGVRPEFVAAVVSSGLTASVDVENAIQLFENGVQPEIMRDVRALGFGPYAAADVIRLAHNGVNVETFEALKAVSGVSAPAEHAIQFRQNGVTTNTVREAQQQGFKDLTFEQILKLHRAGVI